MVAFIPMAAERIPTESDPLLSAGTVAEIVGLSPATLRRYRAAGSGPPWMRIGERLIRYPRSGVREWIASQSGSAVA